MQARSQARLVLRLLQQVWSLQRDNRKHEEQGLAVKIEFRDPEAAKGFTMIENSVMFNPSLSCGAVRVYGALKHYAYRNESPGREQIAADLGIGVKPLGIYCKELETAGLLSMERHFGKPNTYIIESVESTAPIRSNRRHDSVESTQEVLTARPGTDEDEVVVSNETTPALAESKTRKSDPLWDALIAAKLPAPQTKNERGRWNVALKQLREANVDAQEIPAICGAFRKKWPMMTLTPIAIASNLSLLRPDPARRAVEWSDADLAAADERRNRKIEEALGESDRARGQDQELPTEPVAPTLRELRGRRPAVGEPAPGGRRDDGRNGALPLLLEGLAGGVSADGERPEEGPVGFRGLLAGPGHPNGVAAQLAGEPGNAAPLEPGEGARAA